MTRKLLVNPPKTNIQYPPHFLEEFRECVTRLGNGYSPVRLNRIWPFMVSRLPTNQVEPALTDMVNRGLIDIKDYEVMKADGQIDTSRVVYLR